MRFALCVARSPNPLGVIDGWRWETAREHRGASITQITDMRIYNTCLMVNKTHCHCTALNRSKLWQNCVSVCTGVTAKTPSSLWLCAAISFVYEKQQMPSSQNETVVEQPKQKAQHELGAGAFTYQQIWILRQRCEIYWKALEFRTKVSVTNHNVSVISASLKLMKQHWHPHAFTKEQ